MSNLNTPKTFDWAASDLSTVWERWIDEVDLYMELAKFESTGDTPAEKAASIVKRKKQTFLYLLGVEGRETLRSLSVKNEAGVEITDENDWTLEMIKGTLEAFCKPKKTQILDRVGFLRIRQVESESFDKFSLRLRASARKCKWNEATNEDMMVLQIVKWISSVSVREALLSKTELTLAECEKVCRAAEMSRTQSKEIAKDEDEQETNVMRQQRSKRIKDCMFCIKGKHAAGKCPAKGAKCYACGRKDHFAGSKACRGGEASRGSGWRSADE